MANSHCFFENKECKYYPCHEGIEQMNCLFCYCPLYGKAECPGKPKYIEVEGKRIKDCSDCTFPHQPDNYDRVIERL